MFIKNSLNGFDMLKCTTIKYFAQYWTIKAIEAAKSGILFSYWYPEIRDYKAKPK